MVARLEQHSHEGRLRYDLDDLMLYRFEFPCQIPALYREYKRLPAEDKRFFDGKIKRLVELFKEKEIKI